jgi:hypothetical protein
MKVIVFGQIGLRKKKFLTRVEAFVRSKGKLLRTYNVGSLMYSMDKTIRKGRILEKKIPELKHIRARVFDNITGQICTDTSCDASLVNSHATFRWSNGLFLGFCKEEIQKLAPDMCITLIDNIQNTKLSLMLRQHKPEPFTLKDIIVWREEEQLAAEIASSLVDNCKNYVIAIGHGPELLYKLIFESHLPKAYLSYPITFALGHPETWKEIEKFREYIKNKLICFDPFTISESILITEYNAMKTSHGRKDRLVLKVEGQDVVFSSYEIEEVIPNIQGQIIARDLQLVQQSDMVISYIPERDGQPMLSEGVSRELEHAKQCTIDRYVIWPSTKNPSPFLQATKLFKNIDEFIGFVDSRLLKS